VFALSALADGAIDCFDTHFDTHFFDTSCNLPIFLTTDKILQTKQKPLQMPTNGYLQGFIFWS
jgi:hypothetical protein